MCTLGANEVSFLGHCINPKGVHPLPSKVVAVQNFLMPSTVKSLQEFLGMINYYHRFLPAIAATLVPLYASLKGKSKDLKWVPLQESAFCNAKNALPTTAALTFPIPHAPLLLSTDDSNIAIFALLEKVVNTLAPSLPSSAENCPRQNRTTCLWCTPSLNSLTSCPPVNVYISLPWLNTIAPFNTSLGK
ncbi:uncharacterized protein [Palaemon carinicauda]|uniref:uncharacterized protein n=1 Tax=Palaemon carinicauda TaxID=392227 RepID=UPI0035B5D7B1